MNDNTLPIVAFGVMVLGFIAWGQIAASVPFQEFGTGEFGDSFGFVSALSAGVAAILAAWSVILQFNEGKALKEESEGFVAEGRIENQIELLKSTVIMIELWWAGQYQNRLYGTGEAHLGGEPLGESTVRFATVTLDGIIDHANQLTEIGKSRFVLDAPAQDEENLAQGSSLLPVAALIASSALVMLAFSTTAYFAHKSAGIGTGAFGDAFNSVIGLFTSIAVVFTLWSVSLQRVQLRASQAHLRSLRHVSQERQARSYAQSIAIATRLVVEMLNFLTMVTLNNRKLLKAAPDFKEKYKKTMNDLIESQNSLNTCLEEARKNLHAEADVENPESDD